MLKKWTKTKVDEKQNKAINRLIRQTRPELKTFHIDWQDPFVPTHYTNAPVMYDLTAPLIQGVGQN